jgi:dTDP-4-dehydrorhamnose reductase
MASAELCETEQDLAMRTNSAGPAVLATVAQELSVPFVYFSSEYVFDGAAGPYLEDAKPNPISVYGRSKWRGEQAATEACERALILRTTVVYGPDQGRKNFLYALRRALLAGQTFHVPEDQISTPTYNLDLAHAALQLVKAGATGCFNVTGPELFSRADFARAAASFWGLDASLIYGVPTSELGQRAPRPLHAGLLTGKLKTLYPEIHMRTLTEALSHWQAVDPTSL